MANEGVLTERTKFARMKQEVHVSVTAWEGRVKEQGRRLKSIVLISRTSYLETNSYQGPTTRDLCQDYWIRVPGIKLLKKSAHLKQCFT